MTNTIYKKDIKKLTKNFAIAIVKFVHQLKAKAVDYPIRDQLLRSGTSIGANINEAKSSSSRKEYIRFNEIALRSANETQYWMEIINEVFHLEEESKKLIVELEEIKRIIGSSVIKLKITTGENPKSPPVSNF